MESDPNQPLTYDEFFLCYRLHLGDLTRQAKHETAQQGRLPGPAPLGYLNHRTGKCKTTVVLDPEVAPLVREAFEIAARDDRSLRSMLFDLTAKGLRSRNGKCLTVSALWHLLGNPFYAGLVRYEGQLFPGQHEPLVDQEMFDRVQWGLNHRRRRNGHEIMQQDI